ncbi:hypothetical protein D9619_009930 [Psilocybe cf. subviscida]|uniref:VWFA domain-containing protein n=1 Tax=Psilocybe cf. subviscida TaxID=2480587 RepID=A0A8H5BLR2_9AGAR|nr:hypothetical protein D9619_009930 [Psilocybe cf. subviscida]
MFDHPTYSTPNGASVTVTIPPGWFTYISGLARNSFNQMIRIRITNSKGTNTEGLIHSPSEPTETMKLERTGEDSYCIGARNDVQQLELTSYYSTDPQIKGIQLEENNTVVSSLGVLQAETPKHYLEAKYPEYLTFFVFVQASPDQEDSEDTPLYNDAVCTINMIRGTGLDHNGLPMAYPGRGGNETADGATSNSGPTSGTNADARMTRRGTTTGGGTTDGCLSKTTLDIIFVQDCSQQPYIQVLTDNIMSISSQIASSAKLAPDALRLGLISFRNAGDEYVTKTFPFTTDVSVMKGNLLTLVTTGSGRAPETVTRALDAALSSEWRIDATKLFILITDALPHGIGQPDDGSPVGSPAGLPFSEETLEVVRRMGELGITPCLIACEPTSNTSYKYAYDVYEAFTKITGGSVRPLTSANGLADCIISSSLQRVELDALVAKDGKMIARRALFKKESLETLTEAYHAKYMAAGVTVTTLETIPVHAAQVKEAKNVEIDDMPSGVVTAHPFLDAFAHLLIILTNLVRVNALGADILPETASEPGLSSSVVLSKKPISKEQTGRIIKLGITKNAERERQRAELLASGRFIARPTSDDPAENSYRINVPLGWYGFVSGFSRIKYNQAIKLCYTAKGHTSTEFLTSGSGQTDNIMRLERTKEGFYVFTASEKFNIILDASFFWSRDNVEGSELDEPQYTSQNLKVIRTQTPVRNLDFFPDYITYLIMAEDQPDADQVLGLPDFSDCVCIVNLIKKTSMVYNDEA